VIGQNKFMTNPAEPFLIEMIEITATLTRRLAVTVLPNTKVEDLLQQDSIKAHFAGVDLMQMKLGCFGQVLGLTHVLSPGDRIEILHPLIIDPKDARRIRGRKSNLVPRAIRDRSQNK